MAEKRPEISVIVPVYNGEKFIAETIKSVLNQTFKDFELIIVNDGSTDKTLDIVNKFRDGRIRVFSFENQGSYAARNQGLRLSRGRYVSFIDADDLWTKDKLSLQLEALRNNPNAAASYSWTDFIDEGGSIINKGAPVKFEGIVYRDLFVHFFLENGSNALIKKEAADNLKFDESLINGGDVDFFIRLAKTNAFVYVPKYQIKYRQQQNSSSNINLLRTENFFLSVLTKLINDDPSLKYLDSQSKNYFYTHSFFHKFIMRYRNSSLLGRVFLLRIFLHPRRLYFTFPAIKKRILGKIGSSLK
jgi:glycosyltransferase involved in cell wall biosynthesis